MERKRNTTIWTPSSSLYVNRLKLGRRRVPRYLTILSLGVIAACFNGDEVVAPSPAAVASSSVGGEYEDIPGVSRFTVDVGASGSFKPGQPLKLTIAATGVLDTRDIELLITMPEFEVAKGAPNPAAFSVPMKTKLPPVASWRQSLGAGSTIQREASVNVPLPGYYHLVASALTRSVEPVVVGGRSVQDVAHKDIWILVSASGGRVTSSFDRSLLPPGVVPQPGPFRAPPVRSRGGASTTTAGTNAALMLDPYCRYTTNVLCGNVVYYNYDASQYEPVPSAYIYGDYVDQAYGTHTGGWALNTESDGYFEIPCNGSSATYFDGKLDASNYGVVTISPPTMGSFQPYAGDACDWNWGNIIVDNHEVARVYTNLNVTIPASRSFFGTSRGAITVEIFNGGSNGASYFSAFDGKIHINRQATNSQIWGTFGVFTAAHEYGHALQWSAAGFPPLSVPAHTLSIKQRNTGARG